MRYLILGILISISHVGYAQKVLDSIPIKDGKIFYEKIIIVDSSVNKEVLFGATKQWFAQTLGNSKTIIESEDKELGFIIAIIPLHFTLGFGRGNASINETWKVDIKKGRMRVQVNNFVGKQLKGMTEAIVENMDINLAYENLKQGREEKKNDKILSGLHGFTTVLLGDLEKYVLKNTKDTDF